ncbi:MAG: hypothetical protein U5J64_01320 [Halobacteriales archaeon]|nr:hypothetical protein [Halobacteriales archaeon]
MRDTKAQMSVDFLIGILVFAGIIFFAFQFVGSTAAPFITAQTADQKVTKVHTVGDRLYHDKLNTSGGPAGEFDLEYFYDGTDPKNESQLAVELGLVTGATDPGEVANMTDRYEMSVEVRDTDGNLVSLHGEPIDIGESPPSIGGAGARAERVGYSTNHGETVIIDVEVW